MSVKRKVINLAEDSLVGFDYLVEGQSLPLVGYPKVRGIKLSQWIAENTELIERKLHQSGAILFRGFEMSSATDFLELLRSFSMEILPYKERSSPRTQILNGIYTSTDYPQEHTIFLHNENSYQAVWPLKILFFCKVPSETGGETPIADCRRILARIPARTIELFKRKKIMYVRNYGNGFGLPWPTVYQTRSQKEVDEICRRSNIETLWLGDERLRTKAVREAVAHHPFTDEPTWFNHATFFHYTNLDPQIRQALIEGLSEENLPTNSFYGDGSQIEADVIEELREIYEKEKVMFTWERGDVLLADNMLVAHGRQPYSGKREILVGMMQPIEHRQS